VRRALALSIFLVAAGCAVMGTPPCAQGERAVTADTLYFGTAYPGGEVSPGEWSDFLATVVTPRFPQGLTAWSAAGQWRGADGRIVHEPSHVVSLVHARDPATESAIAEVVAEYKSRFHQESVLRVRSAACAGF